MTYQQTIDYLFAQLPMFSRIGAAAYKADLDNTIELCNFLGNPQQEFKSIHIAGTNGKGSTSHMLAAILQTAGYKTGLYTSPHLKDFRERIRINGEMISEEAVIEFAERTRDITDEIKPSFFELTVGMAFDHFAKQKVDVAVIETGLGGRLDSTNIIQPILSIITNIGYDHMNLLGDTLEKIAGEKAGIIKEGTPVIVGETLPATKDIFVKTATAKNAALHLAQDEILIHRIENAIDLLTVQAFKVGERKKHTYQLDLAGSYQAKNLCTVLSAINVLKELGYGIENSTIQTALSRVKLLTGLHGRWDLVQRNPNVILDVGHNEDGIKAILSHLEKANFNNLHIVMGFVKDKEVDKVLAMLPSSAKYYFTQAQIPRALDASVLQEKAAATGLAGEVFNEVNIAVRSAIANAAQDDLVLVCGSVFVVGEVERENAK